MYTTRSAQLHGMLKLHAPQNSSAMIGCVSQAVPSTPRTSRTSQGKHKKANGKEKSISRTKRSAAEEEVACDGSDAGEQEGGPLSVATANGKKRRVQADADGEAQTTHKQPQTRKRGLSPIPDQLVGDTPAIDEDKAGSEVSATSSSSSSPGKRRRVPAFRKLAKQTSGHILQ